MTTFFQLPSSTKGFFFVRDPKNLFDDILREASNEIDDEIDVPNADVRLVKRPKVTGRLRDGRLRGLRNLARLNPTCYYYVHSISGFGLSGTIRLSNLQAYYTASVGKLFSTGLSATIEYVDFDFEAETCMRGGCTLTITKFDMDVGDIRVSFGRGNKHLAKLTELAVDKVKDQLVDVFAGQLQSSIQSALNALNLDQVYEFYD